MAGIHAPSSKSTRDTLTPITMWMSSRAFNFKRRSSKVPVATSKAHGPCHCIVMPRLPRSSPVPPACHIVWGAPEANQQPLARPSCTPGSPRACTRPLSICIFIFRRCHRLLHSLLIAMVCTAFTAQTCKSLHPPLDAQDVHVRQQTGHCFWLGLW